MSEIPQRYEQSPNNGPSDPSDISDDFSRLLVEIAAAGAAKAVPPGAAAARRRGRQRTVRRRSASAVLALALLAGAGGVAAAQTRPSTTKPAPLPPAATASIPPGIVPDPGRYVPAAWLGPAREPFGASIHWMPDNRSATVIEGDVFSPTTTEVATFAPCGATTFLHGVLGAQEERYDAEGGSTGGSANGQNSVGINSTALAATQDIYFYPDAAAAKIAWNALSTASQCKTGTQTPVGDVGWIMPWTDAAPAACVTEQLGKNGLTTVVSQCIVRYGRLIETVSVAVSVSQTLEWGVDFSTADRAAIQAMNQTLRVYRPT